MALFHAQALSVFLNEYALTFLLIVLIFSWLTTPVKSAGLGNPDVTNLRARTASFNCEQVESRYTCFPSPTSVTAYDSSGTYNQIYSTYSDEANFAEGRFGQALVSTGYLGEYIAFTNDLEFMSSKFSVSLWVKQEPWFKGYAPIISFVNSQMNSGWLLDVQDKGEKFRFGVASRTGSIVAAPEVPVDPSKFVHIVATFDGSTVKLFKDGILSGTTKFTGGYDPDPKVHLRIGLDSFDQAFSWPGKIDEFRFFNRPLSEQEVRELYENSTSVIGGLVGHWPFDGDLRDLSNSGNNGQLHSQTVSMAFSPDGTMFFSEKRDGEVKIMRNDRVLADSFVKLSDLYLGDHQGLLGITVDPRFEANHFVYLYQTYRDNATGQPFNRILRFTDKDDKGTNMTIIFDKIPADPGGYYAGGALAFGPDDKLYVTVGVADSPRLAQNISSLLGKILRINSDGSVPSDNPHNGSPVYAVGNKNPYGIAFNAAQSQGIITDNGYSNFDEVNILKPGANYGFPDAQVPSIYSALSSRYDLPIRTYFKTIAPTQAIFYVGDKYPELTGNFIFGSYNKLALHALRIGTPNELNDTKKGVNDLTIYLTQENVQSGARSTSKALSIRLPQDNIAAVAQSPNGEIYFGGYNIYKLGSVGPSRDQTVFPVKTDLPSGVYIDKMELFPVDKTIYLHMGNVSVTGNHGFSTISLDIPRNLLSGIYSVSMNGSSIGGQKIGGEVSPAIKFKIEPSTNQNEVRISISLPQQAHDKVIAIKGTRVISSNAGE
jgi:glucose/arabinose dehydrogenase